MLYQEFYKKSIDSPKDFWKTQSQNLAWFKQQNTILSKDKHDYYQRFDDEQQYNIPSTIDDIAIIDEIKSVYQTHHIGIH